MTLRTPERQISGVPSCKAEISGGIMSYPCTLPQGHTEVGPPEDREPHFAVEVHRTAIAWSAWRLRQDERERNAAGQPEDGAQHIDCPKCHTKGSMRVGALGGECGECGEVAQFASDVPVSSPEVTTVVPAADHNLRDSHCEMRPADSAPGDPSQTCLVCNPNAVKAERQGITRHTVPMDPEAFAAQQAEIERQRQAEAEEMAKPITCPNHPEIVVEIGGHCTECGWPQEPESDYADTIVAEAETAPAWNSEHRLTAEEVDAILLGKRPENVPDIPGITAPLTGIASLDPTKQREGDQRLPAGGDRVVQDQILQQEQRRAAASMPSEAARRGDAKAAEEAERIGLDADIVTRIMAESQRVGISRYGQALHTFDGRLNIRDLADELRDALVYVTKLQMTAEADRETLVRVITEALTWEYEANGIDFAQMVIPVPEIAEIAVNRILDWVLAQRIGPEQVRPVIE